MWFPHPARSLHYTQRGSNNPVASKMTFSVLWASGCSSEKWGDHEIPIREVSLYTILTRHCPPQLEVPK